MFKKRSINYTVIKLEKKLTLKVKDNLYEFIRLSRGVEISVVNNLPVVILGWRSASSTESTSHTSKAVTVKPPTWGVSVRRITIKTLKLVKINKMELYLQTDGIFKCSQPQ